MKALFIILFLISFCGYSQVDTLQIKSLFYTQYDIASKNAPKLVDVDAAIITGENLYDALANKVNMSYYLSDLYYTKATSFTNQSSGLSGVKSRGYVAKIERLELLEKSKIYMKYFIDNYTVKDEVYRGAQTRLLRIESKLNDQ